VPQQLDLFERKFSVQFGAHHLKGDVLSLAETDPARLVILHGAGLGTRNPSKKKSTHRSKCMSPWQSDFIHANGIRLHYTRTGGAKPPLVLAHGFSDDGPCWTSVAQDLASDYDVVMVDARGHGLSDAPEQGYGPLEQSDDLAGVITGLKLSQPIVLGHSMGAMSTLTLAGRYPDLPRAIVLEDPPPWWVVDFDPPFTEEWKAGTRAWITGLQQQTREALIAAQRAEAPDWPEVDVAPWADSKLRVSLKFFDHLDPFNIDWRDLIRYIHCLVLLVTGDPERGALVTPEHARALHTWLPQLSTVHIPGAGHSIHRDQSAAFLRVVRPFLLQVSELGD
jgi:N-formylmaleamate deformylase